MVRLLDDGRGCNILALKAVLGLALLADLYYSDIVALDMTGVDEPDNLGECEPAVSQHIAEAYLLFDAPACHLYGEVNLAHRILFKTVLDGSSLIPLRNIHCDIIHDHFGHTNRNEHLHQKTKAEQKGNLYYLFHWHYRSLVFDSFLLFPRLIPFPSLILDVENVDNWLQVFWCLDFETINSTSCCLYKISVLLPIKEFANALENPVC